MPILMVFIANLFSAYSNAYEDEYMMMNKMKRYEKRQTNLFYLIELENPWQSN